MAKKAAPDSPKVEQKIVQATGVATAVQTTQDGVELSKRIEGAMLRALQEAQASGETNPDTIRAAMLKARDEAL